MRSNRWNARREGSVGLGSEAGFALIEVLVSAVILIVLALATLKVIDQGQATSQIQRSRGVASNLAHGELERVRQMQLDTAETVDSVKDVPVDGVNYHVVTKANWTSDANVVLSCTSTDSTGGQYLSTTSTVTWPNMGITKPVVAESIMTPRAADLDPRYGSLAVKVQDAAGLPLSGATVSVGPKTLITGASGCVTFGRLVEGASTITFSKYGYVDQQSTSPGTDPVTIVRNTKGQKSESLGLATSIPIKVKKTDKVTPSPWPAVSVKSGTFRRVIPGTATQTDYPATTNALYPWATGWTVYAGDCIGNDPETYGVNSATYAAAFPDSAVTSVPGGSTALAGAYLQTVPGFNLKTVSTGGLLGYSIKPDPTAGSPMVRVSPETPCTGGTGGRKALTVTAGAGAFPATDLPYGIWRICVDNGTAGTAKNKVITFNNTPAGATSYPASSAPGAVDFTASGTFGSGPCS